jgi:putative hydrolase of the HAD superfamily
MCGTPEIREGAAPMLKKLKSMNYKLGIISNTVSPTNVIIRLFKNNIYQYFEEDAIFLSTSSQYRKPGTEIFLAATSTLCVKPSEAIYVGDRINKDVVGSRAAKYLASVRILPERAPTDGPEKKHEDTKYIIKKLSELPNMIKKISNIKFKSN